MGGGVKCSHQCCFEERHSGREFIHLLIIYCSFFPISLPTLIIPKFSSVLLPHLLGFFPSQNVFPQSITDDISHLPPIHFHQPMLLRTYHCSHSALYKSCTGWPALFLDSWPLNMGPIGCPKMSVRNYPYSLLDSPEERSYYFSCVMFVVSYSMYVPCHPVLSL